MAPRTVEKILKDDEDKLALGVEDDIEDDIVDNTGKTDAAPTPEETVEEIKKKLAAETERADKESALRRDAEEAAAKASTSAGTAAQSQIVAQEQAITSKIESAKTKLDAAKQQLKQAKAAGDTDAEVELQDALTNARYELNAATWEKGQFDRWKEAQSKKPAVTTERTGDSGYTKLELEWINNHPQFRTSKKFARIAKQAAGEALQNGNAVDTPGYFEFIEESLREEGLLTEEKEPLSGAGDSTTTSVAAAPNRSGNQTAVTVNKNSKYPYIPKGFTIPADWVQASVDQGFDDPREYANMRLEDEAKEKEAKR